MAQALSSTALAGRPLRPVEVPTVADDVAFALPCRGDEVLEVWREARGSVAETGRWPVVVALWSNSIEDELRRFGFHPYVANLDEVDTSVSRIIGSAAGRDGEEVISRLKAMDEAIDYDEFLEWELIQTLRNVGVAPSEAQVRTALGPLPVSHARLDRWLLEWEEAHGRASADGSHLEWFDPGDLGAELLLLPTADPSHVPAYLCFHGAEGVEGSADLIAVLRSWQRRFGAELVAHMSTMLELVVERPPTTLDEAWLLAREHDLVASSTLSSVALRDHARALIGRHTWFLQDRP